MRFELCDSESVHSFLFSLQKCRVRAHFSLGGPPLLSVPTRAILARVPVSAALAVLLPGSVPVRENGMVEVKLFFLVLLREKVPRSQQLHFLLQFLLSGLTSPHEVILACLNDLVTSILLEILRLKPDLLVSKRSQIVKLNSSNHVQIRSNSIFWREKSVVINFVLKG